MEAPCRHCGKTYTARRPGSDPPPQWRGTAERWQDVCNEQQDFCRCRAKQILRAGPATPTQLSLF
jgi:hypothetical protein